MRFSVSISKCLSGTLFIVLSTVCLVAHTAEQTVLPGSGTLGAAIASASSGDVLVLEEGTYAEGVIVVDKSLIIRGTNNGNDTVITATSFTINGSGIDVVLQGVDLAVSLTLTQADSIKILENEFLSGVGISATNYKTSEGDGDLFIVGNYFSSGSITTINANGFYVAGNTLVSGGVSANASGWILGNRVVSLLNADAIRVNSSAGVVNIIGNRITLTCTTGSSPIYGILSYASKTLAAGNLVKLVGTLYRAKGISLTSGGKVVNNTVIGKKIVGSSNASVLGIVASVDAVVKNNVVTEFSKGQFGYAGAISAPNQSGNLCHNNTTQDCGSDAIYQDPLFIDTVDFKLSNSSPAIDAGIDTPEYADLDRSRNDIGAYGGPWSIGQYDAQRDPNYTGPFVYPLFDANSSFIDGQLQVRALGVARLR